MKPRIAFLLRFALPTFYASLLFVAIDAIEGDDWVRTLLGYFPFFLIVGYIWAGAPSLFFAFLMGRFSRRRPAAGARLIRASLLGLTSGLLIGACFGPATIATFLPVGVIAGLATESTLLALDRPFSPPRKT